MDPATMPSGNDTEERDFFQPNDEAAAQQTAEHTQPEPIPQQPAFDPEVPAPAHDSILSGSLTWSAPEYIAYHKPMSWYVLLAFGGIVAAAIAWFLTQDIFVVLAVTVGIGLLGVYASHTPKELAYTVDAHGITIGGVQHPFGEFKSFALMSEGDYLRLELTPLKRIAMYTTIYFNPKDKDRLVAILSSHLPMEARQDTLTDSVMRRIHF